MLWVCLTSGSLRGQCLSEWVFPFNFDRGPTTNSLIWCFHLERDLRCNCSVWTIVFFRDQWFEKTHYICGLPIDFIWFLVLCSYCDKLWLSRALSITMLSILLQILCHHSQNLFDPLQHSFRKQYSDATEDCLVCCQEATICTFITYKNVSVTVRIDVSCFRIRIV